MPVHLLYHGNQSGPDIMGRSRSAALTSDQQSEEAVGEAFEKAVNAGTDAALIEFIRTSKSGSRYDQMAVDKLQSYKTVRNNTLIPWAISQVYVVASPESAR